MGVDPERRRIFRVAIVATFVLVGYILIFSESGFLNQRGYQYEIDQLQQELEVMRTENVRLRKEIDDLHNNPAYIEKLARELFGMVKPGEQSIRTISGGDTDSRSR